MIERIYILCPIIIIKSEVWTITHCLGLGHDTMECAVCLFYILTNYDGLTLFVPGALVAHFLSKCYSCLRRFSLTIYTLQLRHNGPDSVSHHQPNDCLLNRLFKRRSKKSSKLRATGVCAGNSPLTGEFLAQRTRKGKKVSIWWRHHDKKCTSFFWLTLSIAFNRGDEIYSYFIYIIALLIIPFYIICCIYSVSRSQNDLIVCTWKVYIQIWGSKFITYTIFVYTLPLKQ